MILFYFPPFFVTTKLYYCKDINKNNFNKTTPNMEIARTYALYEGSNAEVEQVITDMAIRSLWRQGWRQKKII